jgi:hypothetical protein
VRIAIAAVLTLLLAGCGGERAADGGTTTSESVVIEVEPRRAGAESDQEWSLYCRLRRDGRVVEVVRAPDARDEPDPLDECAARVRDGWELLPVDELWESDGETGIPGDGGCFVATARFELEVEGLEQPQRVCDSVAERYLPVPVAYRTLPVPDDPELLADVVCDASRDGMKVKLLRTPGVPKTIDAGAVCDTLERDGWKVVPWR